jgi:dihydropteroate synthase
MSSALPGSAGASIPESIPAHGWVSPVPHAKPRPWRVGDRLLGGDRPLIMGILNVTPDSFHDGGRHAQIDQALRHAESMLAAGADIIDIGGESTRPGSEPVPEADELARTLPAVRAIVRRFACPVSIDTVKSPVARAALDEGACIINDISAMTFDPMMLELPQAFRAGVVLNHIQGTPRDMQKAPVYGNVVAEVAAFLRGRIQLLAALGVAKDRIAVDPGIGFGKRLKDNYRLIAESEALDDLGCPILLGMSRKSFIGLTPGLEASDRLVPSVALAVLAALKGVSILRVHDVRETREALAMVAAVRSLSGPGPGPAAARAE